MFNNANVLFKTKFVDGVSTVARFAQNQNGGNAASQQKMDKSRSKDKRNRMQVDEWDFKSCIQEPLLLT